MKTSLQKKILDIYVTILVPFLLFMCLLFYIVLSIQLDDSAVASLKDKSYNSQIYAMRYLKTIEDGHLPRAFGMAANHFAKYMSQTEGVRVQIYDNEKLLADSDNSDKILPRTKDIRHAFDSKAYAFFYYDGVRYLSFSSPVLDLSGENPGECIGVIRYLYTMEQEGAFILKVMTIMLIASIMMSVISTRLTKRMSIRVTQSLNELKKNVEIMQAGELSQPVLIQSDDEIEELGNAFDKMRIRLKEYIEKLDAQSDQLHQFFNNVAHQLKTPLTSIIGYSQMIQVSNDPDEICEDAFVIEEAGEKLLKSVDSMILKSRRELEWAPLHISRCSAAQVSEDCIKFLLPRLKRTHIEAHNLCSNELIIQSDIDVVKEIILTLMDNAIIHSNCSNLYFEAEKKDSSIYFRVIDDGCGIPKEERDYIFTAFYQGSSNAGKGSGLGLSICKVLSERINGRLGIAQNQREGTEFVLELPILEL